MSRFLLPVAVALTALPAMAARAEPAPPITSTAAAAPGYAQRTARNRAIFLDFVEMYYRQRLIRPAFEKHVAPDYIQHNPAIADGREAAIAWLEKMTAGASVTMDLRRILVDGDYAVVHLIASQGPQDTGHAIMNIFRLAEGKIVEHWDVTQKIPATTASGRPLG